jgi:hypothetical protein
VFHCSRSAYRRSFHDRLKLGQHSSCYGRSSCKRPLIAEPVVTVARMMLVASVAHERRGLRDDLLRSCRVTSPINAHVEAVNASLS